MKAIKIFLLLSNNILQSGVGIARSYEFNWTHIQHCIENGKTKDKPIQNLTFAAGVDSQPDQVWMSEDTQSTRWDQRAIHTSNQLSSGKTATACKRTQIHRPCDREKPPRGYYRAKVSQIWPADGTSTKTTSSLSKCLNNGIEVWDVNYKPHSIQQKDRLYTYRYNFPTM